jgi:hypothetical protein
MPTQAQIVNQALAEIAAQYTVSGTNPSFDGSAAGNAAGLLYTPAVQTLLRAQDYEFSRQEVTLVASGNTPPYPWTSEFLYPSACLRLRQVQPTTWTINDPQPVRWNVGNALVSAADTRVIWTTLSSAVAIITSSNVLEPEWDAVFTESFVRFLGSLMAPALAGRIDLSRKMLGDVSTFSQIGQDRDS